MIPKRFYTKAVTKKTISKAVQNAKYENRGIIALRAIEMENQIKAGKKFKFNTVVPMNTGNPQALGQPCLTFGREVISLCLRDQFGTDADFSRYSKDSIDRAKYYLDNIDARALGAYASNTSGYDVIKDEVVDFIKRRDDIEIDKNNLYLSTGSSEAIEIALRLMISGPNDGVMLPIPYYPLYGAALVLYGGVQVPYHLDESQDWGVNPDHLEAQYKAYKDQGINIKGIVSINPGNPTGHVLTKQHLKDTLQFAHDKNLVVFSDEVYQENIYYPEKKPFHSMLSVFNSMGDPIRSNLEVISMHSASKGFFGECGFRGGYFEFHNLDQFAKDMIYKLKSMKFCPPTPGMIMVGAMVNPPREGVNSPEAVELYESEKNGILSDLKRRGQFVHKRLNEMPGITANPVDGAYFTLAKVDLPKKLKDEADMLGLRADMHFCKLLLEDTGLALVPGSGFGMITGEPHIRLTNLVPDDALLEEGMDRMHAMVTEMYEKYT